MAGAADGDSAAFARLYDATSHQAFAVALLSTRCPQAAAEVVRRAYLEIWKTAATYQAGWMSARAWVLAVVHEHAVSPAH